MNQIKPSLTLFLNTLPTSDGFPLHLASSSQKILQKSNFKSTNHNLGKQATSYTFSYVLPMFQNCYDCIIQFIQLFLDSAEQFSIGYCKTKTKVITLANHKANQQSSEHIKLDANTCSWCQAQENVCERVTISFVCTSD